jgi:hypothetical protein
MGERRNAARRQRFPGDGCFLIRIHRDQLKEKCRTDK